MKLFVGQIRGTDSWDGRPARQRHEADLWYRFVGRVSRPSKTIPFSPSSLHIPSSSPHLWETTPPCHPRALHPVIPAHSTPSSPRTPSSSSPRTPPRHPRARGDPLSASLHSLSLCHVCEYGIPFPVRTSHCFSPWIPTFVGMTDDGRDARPTGTPHNNHSFLCTLRALRVYTLRVLFCVDINASTNSLQKWKSTGPVHKQQRLLVVRA